MNETVLHRAAGPRRIEVCLREEMPCVSNEFKLIPIRGRDGDVWLLLRKGKGNGLCRYHRSLQEAEAETLFSPRRKAEGREPVFSGQKMEVCDKNFCF